MSRYLRRIFIVLALIHPYLGSRIAFGQKLPEGAQVLTFFSDADDTEQPYGLYIPQNYDPSKKYPLVMMLHGAGSNHRLGLRRVFGKSNVEGESDLEASRYFPQLEDVDYIVASPYARGTAGYQGIPEQDVYDVLEDVKKRFNVDENRTYLTGLSMGGGGALWLGLTRPDIWAAIAPVCPAPPPGAEGLAANALNFPVHFFHGDSDPVVPVEGTRKWVAEMQDIGVEVTYKEFVDVKHDSWVSAYDAGYIFEWFKTIERIPFPNQVRFASKFYKYNKAYWVEFDKLVTGETAEINAKIEQINKLTISTKNLDAFSLHLKGHPKFLSGKEITLTIDKTILVSKASEDLHLVKDEKGWILINTYPVSKALEKKRGFEGPLFEVFSSRHVYVYGTADKPDPDELKKRVLLAQEAANWSVYRGDFLGRVLFFPRVISDLEVRQSDVETSNLVLFGSKETNLVIGKYSDKLPVSLKSGISDYGLFYVFPIDKHYVAVSSGLPWWQGAKEEGSPFVPVPFRKLPELKDLLLFKGVSGNIVTNDYFTQNWKVSSSMKAKLVGSGVITINQ